jgi:hypothetical protein
MTDSKKISYVTDGLDALAMTPVPKDVMEKGRGPLAMTPIPDSPPEERGRGPVAMTPVPVPSPTPAAPVSDSAAQAAQSDQGDHSK